MSKAVAPEIETTEDPDTRGATGKKLAYQSFPSTRTSTLNASNVETTNRERNPSHGNVDQHCGSRGRELIKMLRSESDKTSPETEPPSFYKRLKSFTFSYAKQWTCGFHFRIIFASHLIFWMSLLPAVALGSWLQLETDGGLGIVEVLISTCFSGLVFGALGTQPLMILGVSVPTLVFTVAVSQTAKRLSVEFVPWLSWIGLWCSLLLLFLAASGACRLIKHLTYFSWEILRLFVGFSLVWIGFTGIIKFFSVTRSLEASLLSLWLATCTFVLAVALSGAKTWRCLNAQARELIHNYGPALTFLIFTVLPLLPKFQHIQFQRVEMPDYLYRSDNFTSLGALIRLKSVPTWAILLAFIPGALLACMIFVDQSATSVVLKHAGDVVLAEKTPRSWDLFIISLLTCACSLYGMPFCYGLSIPSLAHKRALTYHVNVHDEEGEARSRDRINSQRVSALIVSLLCGIPFVPGFVQLLEKIPVGVIAGMFLEMAFSCLKELKAVKRLKVFFTVYESSNETFVCRRRIYCTVQIISGLTIFGASRSPAGLIFPLFMLLVILFRHYVLLKKFNSSGLASLDSSLISSKARAVNIGEEDGAKANEPGSLSRALKVAHVEVESSSSPHSRGSPSMLIMPSTRRLKERSRRRNKRKRQGSGSAARTEDDQEQQSTERKVSYSTSAGVKVEENKDSSGVFSRCKRRAVNIELHSNLLYDHGWQKSVVELHGENELEVNVLQSPVAHESPHRPPSPASSQVNGYAQQSEYIGGGSNSSHSSGKIRKASAVFSTTQNPCFVQEELGQREKVGES